MSIQHSQKRSFHLNPALATMSHRIAIERDISTEIFVGSIPGIPGANTQGEIADKVRFGLDAVIQLLRAESALESKNVN